MYSAIAATGAMFASSHHLGAATGAMFASSHLSGHLGAATGAMFASSHLSRRLGDEATVDAVSKKIGLLDHMGAGNLGDDTTQTAVMNNIKRRWPNAEICGFSMNPSDTRLRHGIASYAIRRATWGSN